MTEVGKADAGIRLLDLLAAAAAAASAFELSLFIWLVMIKSMYLAVVKPLWPSEPASQPRRCALCKYI